MILNCLIVNYSDDCDYASMGEPEHAHTYTHAQTQTKRGRNGFMALALKYVCAALRSTRMFLVFLTLLYAYGQLCTRVWLESLKGPGGKT